MAIDLINPVSTNDASEEINSQGQAVTLGAVDSHTHLNAQIDGDAMMTPLSWRGMTNAPRENCGVIFARGKRQTTESF